jgi:hypothetical protein
MNSKSTAIAGVRGWHLLTLLAGVLGLLAGARTLFSVPKPLLVVTAGVFVLCASVFWVARKRMTEVAMAQIIGLILAWVTLSALLFGAAFWLDRAGWIWFRLTGYNVTLSEDYSSLVDLSVTDFVRRHSMFEVAADDASRLVLRGDHVIDRTLVIPHRAELVIEPGTVLRFGRGCSLVSYGPIVARGTEEQPIRFTARHPLLKWGVVGIVGSAAGRRSLFEHTRFEHGRQARVNGIDFRGCLSVIGGSVVLRHSRFEQVFGKDAMYVRGGNVLIHDNIFRDTFKDGLDLDGGSGEIRQNRFVDCGDEGIDLSNNGHVEVRDNTILDERGGRIGADQNLTEIRASNTLGFTKQHASATAASPEAGARR